MSPNTLKKLLFSLSFLFLPLIIFSQSNRTQSVALIPFWGPDGPYGHEQFIQEFGEELYKAVNGLQGYRSQVVDMSPEKLPPDVPEGGFPPYICPLPSLVGTSTPIALTGELTPDPDDDEWWHVRLYLWEMADQRLVFSDEVMAYDREELSSGLNGGWLQWLFDWLKKSGRGSGGDGSEGDTSNLYGGKKVFITTSMPLQWIYIGARVGASPLRLQDTPKFKGVSSPDDRYVESRYESVNAALSVSIALFPESIPFFSRFVVQAEGIFNYDFEPQIGESKSPSTMTVTPAALLKFQVYRHGNMLFSLFGGAYTPFTLNDKIAYGSLVPIGWTTGLSFGGKLEPLPGIFFIDLRYSNDEFNTFVTKDDEAYRRKAITISVGYEFGLFTKK